MFAILVAILIVVVFGLLFPVNGALLLFAPERWAKLPRYLRPTRGINVGIAWSHSRSSIWMRRVVGIAYLGIGATVWYFAAAIALGSLGMDVHWTR